MLTQQPHKKSPESDGICTPGNGAPREPAHKISITYAVYPGNYEAQTHCYLRSRLYRRSKSRVAAPRGKRILSSTLGISGHDDDYRYRERGKNISSGLRPTHEARAPQKS